ncbi:MAG TPA: DNA-processing protein DprA [Gemmatimonadales bacterium]|jgi:DNA processing protein|nr:DNA-processing protein DprA [Gemmatimonadales bacterium]
MDDQRLAYLALAQVPGIGPARLDALLAAFQTPLGALAAPFELLGALPGFSRAAATALKSASPEDGRRLVEATERLGGRVLLSIDPEFPPVLRIIPDPPPVLFALGDLRLLDPPAVAIVGSRDHTAYGAEVCRLLASEAAAMGVLVVSGMARGLDAVAHCGALDAGGSTIGVLGNGLGVVYPAANRELYERVRARGLLLSEFSPGEKPHAGSFPRRNRLISGLARVTVVVEAAVGSGALITAGTALDQGREVLAVPGPVTSAVSVGCNRLIRDGATPFLEPVDLLQHYPECERALRFAQGDKPQPASPVQITPLPESLTHEERALALLLDAAPLHLDALVARSSRPAGDLLSLLCGLELAGVVEQCPGRLFRRR